MIKLIFAKVLIVMLLASTGCNTISNGDKRSQFFAQLAIEQATMKFIERSENPLAYANEVVAIAEEIKEYTDDTKSIRVFDLVEQIHSKVPYTQMALSDQVMARALIDLIAMEIETRAEKVKIDAETKIAVSKIASIVIRAAEYYAVP